MARRALTAWLLSLACGGDAASPLRVECPCGSPLSGGSLEQPSYDEQLASLRELACDGVFAFRGECADGKVVLYANGGLGHTGLYYAGGQLVGTTGSSDIYSPGCPSNHYYGSLRDVSCDFVNAEPLCPDSPYPGTRVIPDPLIIPFSDGRLMPWCELQE